MDGFVLAGGASTRMGADKARVPWLARPFPGWEPTHLPMALATAITLRAVCGRVALVRRSDDGIGWPLPDGRSAEVLIEPAHAAPHPLYGVACALGAARSPLVAIVPCDVPGLSPESWDLLLRDAPSVATDGLRRHPLVAVLPASFATRAAALAASGVSAHALTDDVTEVEIPAAQLVDRNRPEDLGPGPVARLLEHLPELPREAIARIVAGERGRLLARGILDPDPAPEVSWPSPEGA